ncbi:hypothetical protein D3C80_592620 [compost metagenome]|jgi:hypothetical protein
MNKWLQPGVGSPPAVAGLCRKAISKNSFQSLFESGNIYCEQAVSDLFPDAACFLFLLVFPYSLFTAI